LLSGLRSLFGDRFSTAYAVREHHGRDESRFDPMLPDVVVFPEANNEVAASIRLCDAHRTPVIAYGAGTSLEGHLLAAQGGVTIDLSREAHRLHPCGRPDGNGAGGCHAQGTESGIERH